MSATAIDLPLGHQLRESVRRSAMDSLHDAEQAVRFVHYEHALALARRAVTTIEALIVEGSTTAYCECARGEVEAQQTDGGLYCAKCGDRLDDVKF